MRTLRQEMQAIARLPHEKNEFESDRYAFSEYPRVHTEISLQAGDQGFLLPSWHRTGSYIPYGKFELQTHQACVEEHTDSVKSFEYFGIFPVRSKRVIKTTYHSCTDFNHYQGRNKAKSRLEVGKLVVFHPSKPHSLLYYGEETTFMLFSLWKDRSR